MLKMNRVARFLMIGSFLLAFGMTSCTKRPTPEQLNKLEESRSAAESAEKKLAQLRKERAELESQLEAKKAELQEAEAQRDDLKQKMQQKQSN